MVLMKPVGKAWDTEKTAIQDKLVESSEMTTCYSLHTEEFTLFLGLGSWESDHKTSRHYGSQHF